MNPFIMQVAPFLSWSNPNFIDYYKLLPFNNVQIPEDSVKNFGPLTVTIDTVSLYAATPTNVNERFSSDFTIDSILNNTNDRRSPPCQLCLLGFQKSSQYRHDSTATQRDITKVKSLGKHCEPTRNEQVVRQPRSKRFRPFDVRNLIAKDGRADRQSQNECQCPVCGKTFNRHWLLQGHLRIHTGEKPFRCHICPKAFADKSNLRAHVQTHSGVKPFMCHRCGKSFALKSYLSKHTESACVKLPSFVHRQEPKILYQ